MTIRPAPVRRRCPRTSPSAWPGLWQRVGEYWWLGMDAGMPQEAPGPASTTRAARFPANQDANFAWSAAFVSYVMRIAGAGLGVSRIPRRIPT